MNLLSIIVVWITICMSITVPSAVHSDPIKISFSTCRPANYTKLDQPLLQCCPPESTKPILDGIPPPTTSFTRVRRASQCTDSDYAKKIDNAYALMRALPDDDPRSLSQQWKVHCAYCGGSFLTSNSSNVPMAINVHNSWLFLPWHRFYLYFHERILQTLLDDPTFSLNYWNWDNPYTVADGTSKGEACLNAGQDFPAVFGDPAQPTFDINRSTSALGKGRLPFPDLTFNFELTAVQQLLYNASAEELISSNLNVMYHALVSGGTTSETFMGNPYRAGETAPSPGGAGSLESSAHNAVHSWTGRDTTLGDIGAYDMGILAYAARDPVFFSHHGNIDRLFQAWKSIGPILGKEREYYSDPDFLNAEFLFYDEKKDLRRVKVKDGLDTVALGYVYQEANDKVWIKVNQTRCSNLNYSELITQAESLSTPTRDSDGDYHLQAGEPFVLVIYRPNNPHGLEEFLTIGGIKVDTSRNAGFDVFVDLLYPSSCGNPCKCAEYTGRFINMAQARHGVNSVQTYVWKRSISMTLVDIQAPSAPSKIVVTILPLSHHGHHQNIKFASIAVCT